MNDNNNEPRVYEIRDYRLPDAEAKLAKLNARGARLGCAPAVLTVIGWKNEPVWQTFNGCIIEPRRQVGINRYALCTIIGEAPKFAGWQLGACIEHTDGGNIMRKSPDCLIELDARFRTCSSGCDHCNTVRNRKETFVVIHDSGDQKLVGRDCIRDFLGHDSPENILQRAEWAIALDGAFDDMEDGDETPSGCWSSETRADVDCLLAFASCAIRAYGFISGARALRYNDAGGNMESTGATAMRWLMPPPTNMSDKERAERQVPAETDVARAASARQYILTTLGARESSLSDFEHNLLVACRAEAVDRKNIGLVAFVVEYHAREVEKSLAQAKSAESSHYPAEPKTRVKGVKVRYLRSVGYESQWGAGYFHFFTTAEGSHTLKWSTGSAMDNVEPGTEYAATFTVKAHNEYRGAKQTTISRVVLS